MGLRPTRKEGILDQLKPERVPIHVKEAYLSLLESIENLELQHHRLPSDSETPQGKEVVELEDVDDLAKWMLERTTCIQKEIAKQMVQGNLFYLADNPHIEEELHLLRKDLDILKSARERKRRRG